MICMNCGKSLEQDSSVCANCGTRFGFRATSSTRQEVARPAPPQIFTGSGLMAWDVLLVPTATFEDLPPRQSWLSIIFIFMLLLLPGPISVLGMTKDLIAKAGFTYGTSPYLAASTMYCTAVLGAIVGSGIGYGIARLLGFSGSIREWVSIVALSGIPILVLLPAAGLVAYYGFPVTSLALNFKYQQTSLLLFLFLFVVAVIWSLCLLYKGLRAGAGFSVLVSGAYILVNIALIVAVFYFRGASWLG